ncbi:MAG: hypothetical protein ACAI25_00290, partial [Planctomycetota bacterium]
AKTVDVVSNALVAFKQEIVAVEVERAKEPLELRAGQPPRPPRSVGLGVDQIGFLSDAGRRLRITSVEPGSTWDHAGLSTRRVIVGIDGRKVNGIDSFHKALVLAKDPAVLEVVDAAEFIRNPKAKHPSRHVAILFTPELPAPASTPGLGRALGGVLRGFSRGPVDGGLETR